MTVNEFAKEVHENAVAHGWWETARSFPEVAALIHSEVSEALEEWRDAIIRILDYLAYMGVDVEAVLMAKHEYNKGHEYRHGGKRA